MIALSVRNGRAAVLIAWAAFLVWLQVGGQVPRYLGPRTAWIVPAGAVLLTVAAAGYLRYTDSAARRPLGRGEAFGLAAVLAPALAALALSDASLGALAASNKLGDRGIDVSRLAASVHEGSGRIDVLRLRLADEDPELARRYGVHPGVAVEVTGFVFETGPPLRLARFYYTCCVADALAVDVPVHGARRFPRDTWLKVRGFVGRRDGHLVIEGAAAERVPPPERPYLPL